MHRIRPFALSGNRESISSIFIGELDVTTRSGVQRLWALEQCGVHVIRIDTAKYRAPIGRIGSGWARLTERFHLLYSQDELEADILAATVATSPAIIWFEWPRSFQPTFIERLKSACPAAKLISFQDDNPFGTRHGDAWQWKNYLRCIPLFDLHLIKRPADAEHLRAYGAPHTRLWMHGIYPPLFHPPNNLKQKRYPVSFVGTCFDDRAAFFDFLISRCKLPVHVFGSHWERRSRLPQTFPDLFHAEVLGEAYAEVIHQSIICLGMVSTSNNDEWSLRTFEIPGCAGTLLAQRTPTHESMFREGKEAMFFADAAECAAAIRGLLLAPDRAKAMGAAALERCKADNSFISARMASLLRELSDLQESSAQTPCS